MITIRQILEQNQVINFVGKQDAVISKPIQFLESNVDPSSLMWVNDKNADKLNAVKYGVIICSEKFTNYNKECNYLVVKNPRYFFKNIIEQFFLKKEIPSISRNCIIDETVSIGNNVTIGHYVVIEENVTVGDNVNIGHHTIIKKDTVIKNNAIIGCNNTIGGVGFGYEKNEAGEFELIPHIGNVIINSYAEIGNNTCIDKAVLGSTIIGENVKIDNLVHIAHGVIIGKNSLIIAHAMIGGSTVIGENVWFAPTASILNKKNIGNNAVIGMGAVVVKDVAENETIIGNPGKALNK